MLPYLTSGDFVIATRFHGPIKVDDLLVINHSYYGRIIKRVKEILPDHSMLVTGDNNESISSEQIGWIKPIHVQGKVLLSIKQKTLVNQLL